MKNKEKYSKKIVELACDGNCIAVDKNSGKVDSCICIPCRNCLFDDSKDLFNKINTKTHHMSKSTFRQIIADVSYIEDFEVEKAPQQFKESIITLYDTKMDTQLLFKKIGIDILSSRILDSRTVFLDENQAKLLYEKAPYLVSMATEEG